MFLGNVFHVLCGAQAISQKLMIHLLLDLTFGCRVNIIVILLIIIIIIIIIIMIMIIIIFFLCQINTISGDTVQMQLECKSMRKANFEQMRSPVSASFTTSFAVAMGYETLSSKTIPVESVFLGMGDLQDKMQPMPVKVCMP